MSKSKNGGLDQYGAESFEQQQFETAATDRVKTLVHYVCISCWRL